MVAAPQSIARDLRSLVRGDVEFDSVSRHLYSTDAGLTQILPLGVVSPRDTADVVRIVTYASEVGLSVIPRGMGSGLNGGAVGPGIQIDFSRYMNSVVEIDPEGSWIRVQPGVVLARLNALLRPRGVFFPPDPSSENHCSLGGMIGTNASGARTVAYGATKDFVRELEVVMADGSLHHSRPATLDHLSADSRSESRTFAAAAFSTVLAELAEKRDLIASRLPKVVKNSCGYRVETLLGHFPSADIPLQKLFVGAEGTLGIVTEATLGILPLPARRGVAMAYFPTVFASGEAVPGILALLPSAVEIMDSRFLDLVRRHDPKVDAMLPYGADTALLIEFEGADGKQLDEKFATLARNLDGSAALRLVRAADESEAESLWRMRRSAVPLMQRSPGRRQPLPFVEDITVPPTKVPECIAFLQRLFDREGIQAVMVGHIGDGNLHTRPLLDPRDPQDRVIMQRVYDEVATYVLGVGGTLSGEHGDGLVHTPRLEAMYGPEVYQVFTHIKEAFDPRGVLNPGKKTGEQLSDHKLMSQPRYGATYKTNPQRTVLCFPEHGFENEIERCHGCAACKSAVGTTMCPVYKATAREQASPRAKANLLRAAISGGLDSEGVDAGRVAKEVMDLCIGCGMCAVECPSRVNIPKLVLEARSRYRLAHHAALVDALLGRAETVVRVGAALAPVVNPLLGLRAVRLGAQLFTGLDRRRPLGRFARPPFHRAAAGLRVPAPLRSPSGVEPAAATPGPDRTVAYFYDLFADYYDPGLPEAVLRVLDAHGCRVVLPHQRASGIPEMLYGYARQAQKVAGANIQGALEHVQKGAMLVSAEPTASFAFKVHYPDYLHRAACSLVADATRDLGEFLAAERRAHPESAPAAGPVDINAIVTTGQSRSTNTGSVLVGYHQPCHLKAQSVDSPGLHLLREIPGVQIVDLAAGCCGMAGTFGMKKRSYDLSMSVGEPLFRRIVEASPALLASECSTCRMQLAHATGLPVVHPVVLLAAAYGV